MNRSPVPDLVRPALFADLSGLIAGFTTRRGGVSESPYDELNLGMSTDDARDRVLENRRRVTAALGFEEDSMAVGGQVHGTDVETVTRPGLYPGRDGLVTDQSGILLAIVAADCAAVLLADPMAHVIGACHAGWRGAAHGVLENTVRGMRRLGAEPARLIAWISPCIGRRSFQVGPEVAEQFHPDDVIRVPGDDLPHVDLVAAIVRRLVSVSLDPERIANDGRCTMTSPDLFFSHRANRGVTGRMMGLVGIVPERHP